MYNTLNPEIRTRSREVFQSQYNSVQSSYDPRILSKATHKSNQRSRITRPLKSLQSFCNPEILVQLKNIRPENIELGQDKTRQDNGLTIVKWAIISYPIANYSTNKSVSQHSNLFISYQSAIGVEQTIPFTTIAIHPQPLN